MPVFTFQVATLKESQIWSWMNEAKILSSSLIICPISVEIFAKISRLTEPVYCIILQQPFDLWRYLWSMAKALIWPLFLPRKLILQRILNLIKQLWLLRATEVPAEIRNFVLPVSFQTSFSNPFLQQEKAFQFVVTDCDTLFWAHKVPWTMIWTGDDQEFFHFACLWNNKKRIGTCLRVKIRPTSDDDDGARKMKNSFVLVQGSEGSTCSNFVPIEWFHGSFFSQTPFIGSQKESLVGFDIIDVTGSSDRSTRP